MILCRKSEDMGENKVNENMLEKIEIKKIEKEQFDEYKDEIEKIHNENVFPNNGYLMDEDYIINAEIIFVALLNKSSKQHFFLSFKMLRIDSICSFTLISFFVILVSKGSLYRKRSSIFNNAFNKSSIVNPSLINSFFSLYSFKFSGIFVKISFRRASNS